MVEWPRAGARTRGGWWAACVLAPGNVVISVFGAAEAARTHTVNLSAVACVGLASKARLLHAKPNIIIWCFRDSSNHVVHALQPRVCNGRSD